MRGATALNGSYHRRSKIDTAWAILPSACDTLAEALLLAGLDHDCIAEGNVSRPCGVASTSELPVQSGFLLDMLFLSEVSGRFLAA
jgi:hypothetical protein